jgi:hypothetical protein
LSKTTIYRGWVRAFCIVPVLAVVAIALLVFPTPRRHGAGSASPPLASATGSSAAAAAHGRIQANYAALPLAFEQNQGQTDAQVKYMARGDGYTLFLTANDAVFSLRSSSGNESSTVSRKSQLRARNAQQRAQAAKDSTAVVRVQLAGANLPAKVSASHQMPGKSNYFVGSDPGKWQTDVPHYARVSYQDVYPGVNLAFHGVQRQAEFDFVVAPGANPAPIAFRFTGAQGVKTDASGNLVVSSAAGDILLHKPVAYQEQKGARQPVDAQFVLKANNQVSFDLGNYDRSRELVIDPSVSYEYSTFLGGNGADEGYGIAVDSSGNAYVTGQTTSTNFPHLGGFQTSLNSTAGNAFVTKIAQGGATLIYSTYIGGTGPQGDSGNAITVNASGDAFVAGGTTSSDFPVTPAPGGEYQSTLKGTVNAFVLELGSSGALTYSTYLGGTGADEALGVALDSAGNVLVAGKTSSGDFPTLNAVQSAYPAGSNSAGFVTKLNSTLSSPLAYSTYLGGSSSGDLAQAIAVDSTGNAYVAGQTFSTTFPIFPAANPYQGTCGSCSNGNSNAFVTVITPSGTASGSGFVYSTYLGGTGSDAGNGIAVDSADSAYVTGATTSSNFPTTTGAGTWQTGFGGGTDAFVTKFNPAGSALVYSAYLGGSGIDAGASIAVDGSGIAYVTGQTASSSNFPTANPTQSGYGGGASDAFVSEINAAGTQLVFSTYLGGSGEDDSGALGAIAVDVPGATIYVTGNTTSSSTTTGFPTTTGALQPNYGGGETDAFVTTYSQEAFAISAETPAAVSPGTSGTSTVTLTSLNGYNLPVNLNCSVAGTGTPLPACSATSFSPASPITPTASPGTKTMLTITTTGPSGALSRPRTLFYAMWLPIAGLSLAGMGFSSSSSRRKKMVGFLMLGMVMTALLLMPACGGSSSTTTTTPPPSGGTPAGNYTITITGTDANNRSQSTPVTLAVN